MTVFSGKLMNFSGLVHVGYPKLPASLIQRQNRINFGSYTSVQFSWKKIPQGVIQYVRENPADGNHVAAVGSGRHQLHFDDELQEEPWWLILTKEAIWGLQSLFEFLVEQPSQLKYIEWPSFKSTLKTATLSLFLVAVFIVVLSSVDSALCYLLAVVLRRTP